MLTGLFFVTTDCHFIVMPSTKKSLSTDTIIAIAATITSVCALIIAIYQTKLMREQQLNSVWPYLITYSSVDEKGYSALILSNNGIGPAIIDSMRIEYKNKSYSSPVEVVKEISKSQGRGEYGFRWSYNALRKGSVIPQQQTVQWIGIIGEAENKIFREELENNMKVYVYYKSIYNERWYSVFNTGDEESVIKY